MPGESVRHFEQFLFAAPHEFDTGQRELPRGQGARLVEGNHVDQGEILDRCAAAEKNAPPGAGRDGRKDPGRHGEDECAGGGHNQQCHRAVKCAANFLGAGEGRQSENEPPDEKHHGAGGQDGPCVSRAESVGERL